MDSHSPVTDGCVDRQPFRDSGTIRSLAVQDLP
jgi:hypothetical protein